MRSTDLYCALVQAQVAYTLLAWLSVLCLGSALLRVRGERRGPTLTIGTYMRSMTAVLSKMAADQLIMAPIFLVGTLCFRGYQSVQRSQPGMKP